MRLNEAKIYTAPVLVNTNELWIVGTWVRSDHAASILLACMQLAPTEYKRGSAELNAPGINQGLRDGWITSYVVHPHF